MTIGWRRHLEALALVWGVIAIVFARDLFAMMTIWWTSSTFAHSLLVVPVIAWLVVQRWPALRALVPHGWLPGVVPVAFGALVWGVGELAGVAVARHLGVVLMLQGAVVGVLGPAVCRALLFPLAYTLFLVPAGEALVPGLQTLTARMATTLLQLSGIPATMQGVFIVVPGQWFEVARACSGAQFLIAMTAFGVLAAHLCFRSWPRRIAFVGATLALCVLANGVRAWGTIYIALELHPDFAESFDHVLFGGILFGGVVVVLSLASLRWFDDGAWHPPVEQAPVSSSHGARAWTAGAAIAALVMGVHGWAIHAQPAAVHLPRTATLPPVEGWRLVLDNPRQTSWSPTFAGADRLLVGHYADGHGHVVDLTIAIFATQSEGHELVGYRQGASGDDDRWTWVSDEPGPAGGAASRMMGPNNVERAVVTFYRVGDIVTGSEVRAKLATLRTRLGGDPSRAVGLVVSAPGLHGRQAVNSFLAGMGPINIVTDRLVGLRS